MASRERKANELENLVLEVLWDSSGALSSSQIVDSITSGPKPALTTILTVLSRLEDKGLVSRSSAGGRSQLFRTTESREEHAANALLKILSRAQNPKVALNFFAEGLSSEMVSALKKSLDKNS